MTKENEKNTKITQSINISECFEIQRNLRLLFKDLYNSQTEIEADQNRLKALKYIFETDVLKTEYEKRLKDFERTSKTKKYKDCCKVVSRIIWKSLKADVSDEGEESIYLVKIADCYYIDVPTRFFYPSLMNVNSNDSIIIAESLFDFINKMGKPLQPIINTIFNKAEKQEITNIRESLNYIFDSYIEYEISTIDTDMGIYRKQENETIRAYDYYSLCYACSSICGVLEELDTHIAQLIKSESKINIDNLPAKYETLNFVLEGYTCKEIAIKRNVTESCIEKQVAEFGGIKAINKNREKYSNLLENLNKKPQKR